MTSTGFKRTIADMHTNEITTIRSEQSAFGDAGQKVTKITKKLVGKR